MLHYKSLTMVLLLCIGMLNSCIKDEAPNAECDITRAAVTVSDIATTFYQATDTAQAVSYSDSVITFTVRPLADLTALAPRFSITEGATISPANGSVHDFSNGPVYYTLTSEDGMWKRRYRVQFSTPSNIVRDTLAYDFEHAELNSTGNYYVWYEVDGSGQKSYPWATGNPGFRLSSSTAKAEEYISIPEEAGVEGRCVKLTTRSTGIFGQLAKRPLAAGSIFLGTFDLSQALTNSLGATRFGHPTKEIPLRFSAYYKYQRGATYQDKQLTPYPDKQDYGHIYAVLYRNHDEAGNAVTLDGANVLSSPLIVAIASFDSIDNRANWTSFDIPFTYLTTLDETLLANFGYSLAVVCSSSHKGSLFEGAIGSTLWVDKIRITCNSTKQ